MENPITTAVKLWLVGKNDIKQVLCRAQYTIYCAEKPIL